MDDNLKFPPEMPEHVRERILKRRAEAAARATQDEDEDD